MVEGILVVNLDPPYLGFEDASDTKHARGALKNCSSLTELRQMLIELGVISAQQPWPPRDCAIRVSGSFSQTTLNKLGLGTTVFKH